MSYAGHDITEAELLALIEGEDLGARRAAVEAAIAADPELTNLVAAMRDDRAGLVALAHAEPPADLLDRVAAAMEHRALLGLAPVAAHAPDYATEGRRPARPSPLPTSRMLVRRLPFWQRRAPQQAARLLAVAAGLAMLVGGGMWAARPRPAPAVDGAQRVAMARERNANPRDGSVEGNGSRAGDPSRGAAAATMPALGMGGWEGAGRSDDGPTPPVAPAPVPAGGAEEVSPPTVIASATPASSIPPSGDAPSAKANPGQGGRLSVTEALALAREGKLAIRVRITDAPAALARAELLKRRVAGHAGWLALDPAALPDAYSAVASLWSSPHGADGRGTPQGGSAPAATVVASDRARPARPAPAAARAPADAPPRPLLPVRVIVVDIEDREASLTALFAAFGGEPGAEGGPMAGARYTALSAHILTDPAVLIDPTDDAAVPVNRQGARVVIPIILETAG